jgi:hypothetical protein
MADLRPVSRLATVRYWSRWRLTDGTVVETPLIEAEYAALGEKDAGEPARGSVPRSAVWVGSAGGAVCWDTPDQRLPFGGYDQHRNDAVVMGLDRLDPVLLRLDTGRIEDLTHARQTLVIEGVSYRLFDGTIEKL